MHGEVRAILPFFILDQDLLVGASPKLGNLFNTIRQIWPRFMQLRVLMVGCAAGEGHLDNAEAMLNFRDLTGLYAGLRTLETSFREVVQRVFPPTRAYDARQSTLLRLAAERKDCGFYPLHDRR